MLRGMTLEEFLAAEKLSEAAFAGRLGVSQVTIHRYVKKQRFPDRETILRIESVTDRKVKPADWFESQTEGVR